MAHLAIFKKFDKLKNVGDSFMLSLKPYKNFGSARGTVTSGATDYRKSGNKDFYVRTENYDGALKVTRVKNGKNSVDVVVLGNDDLEDMTVQTLTDISNGLHKFARKHFPHNSVQYIEGLKTRLNESMKPFFDFVKL